MYVSGTLKHCRNRERLDVNGICVAVLELFFLAQPDAFVDWLNCLVASSVSMSQLSVTALPFGKTNTHPSVDQVRLLLPQPAVASLIDIILADKLHAFVNTHIPRNYLSETFAGGRPHTQPLDVAHTLHLCLEKSLDLKSSASVAQLDVKQFFDNLPMSKLARWLSDRHMPCQIISCIFRFQMLVQVRICLSNSFETPVVSNRGKGGLTGSRVALALARIPIEHLLFEFADRWRSRSFEKKVSCGSWIDNLYWVGNNPLETISMAEDASTFLKSVWGLDVKQGSRVYMASLGHSLIPDDGDSLALWKRDEIFRALGHT